MAPYVNSRGRIAASHRRLRNISELGFVSYNRVLRDLESDGWIKRESGRIFLQVSKLEENQQPLNRSKKGSL
jgi:hypothetical protein